MSVPAWVLNGERVLAPGGECAAAILIRDGRIESLLPLGSRPFGLPIVEAGAAVVMPGVVDTHVHLNDPGRAEWEGFYTGTRAAAAGGITTLVDMPLNSIPVTTTLAALQAKVAAATGHCWVDCGFWGGIVPGNLADLALMIHGGALGFKAFLCHSGIDDFPRAEETDLRLSMAILAAYGLPLLAHAELEKCALPDDTVADPRRYAPFLATRPPAMEVEAVRLLIGLCRDTGCAVHVVHLSSADALLDLAAARAEGLPITVETCPHYLVFAAEEIPDGATAFKCAPPIRGAENRERLWQGLRDGVIDFVACDHSPCTPALKRPETGDFPGAWGGISSVQFALPLVWTHARARGFELSRVIHWLCARTAIFAGLTGQKGAIAPGRDADLVLWHPDQTFVVEAAGIHHRHPITPYLGRELQGVVESTYLRGERIYHRGAFGPSPAGRVLNRDRQAARATST